MSQVQCPTCGKAVPSIFEHVDGCPGDPNQDEYDHADTEFGPFAPTNTTLEDSQLAEALDHARKAARIMAELGHTKYAIGGLVSREMLTHSEMEVSQLLQWREKAIKGMPDYRAIGTELGLTIGTDVAPRILPAIIGLKQQRDTLAGVLSEIIHEEGGTRGLAPSNPICIKAREALAAVKGGAK